MPLYGAIEAGGTKFVLAVGERPDGLEEIRRVDTSPSNPLDTVAECVRYFERHRPLAALGIASFGPLDFASGCITTTPKLAWQHFPLRAAFERAFSIPVGFETDVNAAALGERYAGAARGVDSFVYLTVGTGIGGGAMAGGRLVHGLLHPEMGHMVVAPHAGEPAGFTGVCPFHGGCLEGRASGPAMLARWGQPAETLDDDHPGWQLEADYLAQACVSLACILSPQRILLGGGVMNRAHLLPLVRARFAERVNKYLPLPELLAPSLPYPGLSGALALAVEAAAA